jgi:hypothetical protein
LCLSNALGLLMQAYVLRQTKSRLTRLNLFCALI